MKSSRTKYSIPSRVFDLMWSDDEFYRDVFGNKKINIPSFPRYDQWCDNDGFHMEFALAGYSYKDIEITSVGTELLIKSVRSQKASATDGDIRGQTEQVVSLDDVVDPMIDDALKEPKNKMHQGIINRGIARRDFKVGFSISTDFDPLLASASMKDGLLHIVIPQSSGKQLKSIKINGEGA